MPGFISILRGINVSGQKKILMKDLKLLYENLQLTEVKTYIQSGNVVFNMNQEINETALCKKIEAAIFKKYAFEVPVIIRTKDEIQEIINNNPFLNEDTINIDKLHVTFLRDKPLNSNLKSIESLNYLPDRFKIAGREIFLYCPVNYGETKLSNKFFESKLKVSATTRNWKTVNMLFEMLTQ
jgi:uncharacterized protein (DUF1697 family)